jgi:hypothetical protein
MLISSGGFRRSQQSHSSFSLWLEVVISSISLMCEGRIGTNRACIIAICEGVELSGVFYQNLALRCFIRRE